MTFYFFHRYLFSKRSGSVVRTIAWVAMAGTALGVFTMVFVMSIMNGFGDGIRKRLLSVEAHLLVTLSSSKSADISDAHQVLDKILKSYPAVQVLTYEKQDVILRTLDGVHGGAVARGQVRQSVLELISKFTLDRSVQGKSLYEIDLGNDEVAIGLELAESMGIYEGNQVVIVPPETLLLPSGELPIYEKVRVKHVLRTNVADFDSQAIFYDSDSSLRRLSEAMSLERGVELRVPDPENFGDLEQELMGAGLRVSSWKERNSALFYSLKVEKFLMGLFLTLTLVIASFSIVIVLALLIDQKKRDMGMLMSLGLSPQRVRRLFVGLGLLLSGIGVATGLLLGVVVCSIWQHYPIISLPSIYYDNRIPMHVDVSQIFMMAVFGIFIALLSSWLPSMRTRTLSPVEALRGKITPPGK